MVFAPDVTEYCPVRSRASLVIDYLNCDTKLIPNFIDDVSAFLSYAKPL